MDVDHRLGLATADAHQGANRGPEVLPNEGYDVFDMLLTRWKPVVSPESMMKKVLKRFMEKWTDGLCRWLFDVQPTKEEAMDWCQEWMRLLTLDLLAIDSEMHNGLQLIHETNEIP